MKYFVAYNGYNDNNGRINESKVLIWIKSVVNFLSILLLLFLAFFFHFTAIFAVLDIINIYDILLDGFGMRLHKILIHHFYTSTQFDDVTVDSNNLITIIQVRFHKPILAAVAAVSIESILFKFNVLALHILLFFF